MVQVFVIIIISIIITVSTESINSFYKDVVLRRVWKPVYSIS